MTHKGLWLRLSIKGEDIFEHHDNQQALNVVLKECNQRLNLDDQLKSVTVHLVYATSYYDWLKYALLTLEELQNQDVQILSWQSLTDYISQKSTEPVPVCLTNDWIISHILPLVCLDGSWQAHQQLLEALTLQEQMQQAAIKDETKQVQTDFTLQLAQLQSEKQKLQVEIRDVQQRLGALQRPNIESLLSFLPSIFKNFWHEVRPDELANIAGLLTAPQIPSPSHNPSLSAVQAKKRQFLALAETEQQQIIGFCRQLKQDYDLNIHIEFQTIIGALD